MSQGDVIIIRTLVSNCYLVLGDEPFLVDTNSAKYLPVLEKALRDHGLGFEDLRHVLITHFHADHTGNAAELKRHSGARVWAAVNEAPIICGEQEMPLPRGVSRPGKLVSRLPRKALRKYLAFSPVDVSNTLREGDVVPLMESLEVLEMPGHTSGGIGFLQRDRRLAFAGDVVSTSRGKPAWPVLAFSEDKGKLLDSMRRLVELDVDYIFTGHGAVIGPGAASVLGDFVKQEETEPGG